MATPKNLNEVSKMEQKSFIDSFDTLFLDMDGVIWLHFNPIKGASDCIDNLRKIGKNVHFVTNNSIMLIEEIKAQFDENNLKAELFDIVTPHKTIIQELKRQNVKDDIFVIGHAGVKGLLKNNGFNVVPDPPSQIEETIATVLTFDDSDRKVGAVVLDLDFNLSYLKMQKAFWYLRNNADCVFLVTVRDKFAPMGPRGPIFVTYHIVEAIKEMSGKDFTELGKPSDALVNHLINTFEISNPNRVLFIGDSIQSDLSTAAKGGFQKLLVLSGTDKLENVTNWQYPEEYKPQYYAQDLGVINEIVIKNYGEELRKADSEL